MQCHAMNILSVLSSLIRILTPYLIHFALFLQIAEITYLSALKLRNLPTLQFEIWSGQVKVEIPVAPAANDPKSRPGSRGTSLGRAGSRGSARRTASSQTQTISEQVAAAVKRAAPVPGTQEWAKALTSHQLGQLSQK